MVGYSSTSLKKVLKGRGKVAAYMIIFKNIFIGYMVVSTDGYGHMVYGDLQPLVVQTKKSFTSIQIVTVSAPRVSKQCFPIFKVCNES